MSSKWAQNSEEVYSLDIKAKLYYYVSFQILLWIDPDILLFYLVRKEETPFYESIAS